MTSAWPDPDPNPLPTGPRVTYPADMRHDRADIDDTIPVPAGVDTVPMGTRHPAGITVADLGCGHLPGECPNDAECQYWRGVLTGEYAPPEEPREVIVLRPFNLRKLAAQHITAAELDRRERGAA